jgi:hypothetical protein
MITYRPCIIWAVFLCRLIYELDDEKIGDRFTTNIFFRDQSFYLPTDAQESCFTRILQFTLKQILHVSAQSPSSGSVLSELAKVIIIKIISYNTLLCLVRWCGCSHRPIHLNRTNPNNNILRILHSKPNNNKIMRQNNRLKLKSYIISLMSWKHCERSSNLLLTYIPKLIHYNKEKI